MSGEFLGKGTGVTLGTLGTIGFGLAVAQGLGSGNGTGGLLGGLLGGGNGIDTQSALMAENAMLKSENYSDKTSRR